MVFVTTSQLCHSKHWLCFNKTAFIRKIDSQLDLAYGHSLLTPDLVVRASVDEARLSNTTQGFTLSYNQRCPHTPTQQSVSKTLSWPRNMKQDRVNLSLSFYQYHRIINLNSI